MEKLIRDQYQAEIDYWKVKYAQMHDLAWQIMEVSEQIIHSQDDKEPQEKSTVDIVFVV